MNLLASVKSMGLASIMPEYFIDVLGRLEGVKAIPLTDPVVEHQVGLVGRASRCRRSCRPSLPPPGNQRVNGKIKGPAPDMDCL